LKKPKEQEAEGVVQLILHGPPEYEDLHDFHYVISRESPFLHRKRMFNGKPDTTGAVLGNPGRFSSISKCDDIMKTSLIVKQTMFLPRLQTGSGRCLIKVSLIAHYRNSTYQ